MPKAITFSMYYPDYHVRSGEPTYFIMKILKGLQLPTPPEFWELRPKTTTVRVGYGYVEGQKRTPRYWEHIPYRSKHIVFSPDITITKTEDFDVIDGRIEVNGVTIANEMNLQTAKLQKISDDDGFDNVGDFLSWIKYPQPFQGQIVSWT